MILAAPHDARRLRHALVLVVGVATGWVLLAQLAWQLGTFPGNVAPVWPAVGMGAAALLMGGRAALLGILVGELVAETWQTTTPVGVALLVGLANCLEAQVLVWCWHRFVGPSRLTRAQEVLKALLSTALAALVGAVTGVGVLWLGGQVDASDLLSVFFTWAAGDVLGLVLVVPLVVVWAPGAVESVARTRARAGEGLVGITVVGVVVLLAFSTDQPRAYVVFPLLLWAAFRAHQRGTTLSLLVIAFVAVLQTGRGEGPFGRVTGNWERLAQLDVYLAVVAVTTLLVAGLLAERDSARSRLRSEHAEMEAAVADRTAALQLQSDRLAEAQHVAALGSWEWDVQADRVVWSDELYLLFGVSPAHFDGTYSAYLELLHPEDRDALAACVQQAYGEGLPYEMVHRLRETPDGVRWLRSRGQAFKDAAGTVVRMSGTAQDVTATVHLQHALEHRVRHDALTGLANRETFTVALAEALARGDRSVVLFCDLDRFKWINDSLGHEAGDRALQAVADRLVTSVRPGDLVARFGGDEFAVLCAGPLDDDEVAAVATRVQASLEGTFPLPERDVPLGASTGVAVPLPGETVEQVLRNADTAMYAAKAAGGGRFVVFEPALLSAAERRLDTVHELHAALRDGQLAVHYQPVVALPGQEVLGVEALVRWNHPRLGTIEPAHFLEVAEQSGLVHELGRQVLVRACLDLVAINASRPHAPLTVAVNVTPRELLSPGFAEGVLEVAAETGLSPTLLCLEITESALVEDQRGAAAALEDLREAGVALAIDDFGTGYSSLLYLRQLPVSSLKVDRAFVAGMPGRSDVTIVDSVLGLARGLGLGAVAEGVETAEQLQHLVDVGCPAAQGYAFSRPLPVEDLRRWLALRAGPTRVPAPRPAVTLHRVVGG